MPLGDANLFKQADDNLAVHLYSSVKVSIQFVSVDLFTTFTTRSLSPEPATISQDQSQGLHLESIA